MALILAIESDRRQVSHLTAMVRGRLRAILGLRIGEALTFLRCSWPRSVLSALRPSFCRKYVKLAHQLAHHPCDNRKKPLPIETAVRISYSVFWLRDQDSNLEPTG